MISSSRSSPTNTQHSTTNVSNLNLQDVEGITLLDSTGNTIVTTDYGAIDAALDIGVDALRVGRDVFDASASLAGRGLDNAMDLSRSALDANTSTSREALRFGEGAIGDALSFGRDALDLTSDTTRAALEGTGRVAMDAIDSIVLFGDRALEGNIGISRDAMDAVTGAQSGVLDFAMNIFGDALGAQRELTGANLEGLTSLAKQTSESADDRVTRTALYAFAAVAAIFVIPAIMGKR